MTRYRLMTRAHALSRAAAGADGRPGGSGTPAIARRVTVIGVLALAGGLALTLAASAATAQATQARLGAAVSIAADGSPPWEDRPITIVDVGVLAGTAGVADPGDDLGPNDGVVRTYDTLTFRLSYYVLDSWARDLVLTATLDPGLVWATGEEARLSFAGCPAHASVDPSRRVLTCRVGYVSVPPAVTGVVDAVARVLGSAPNGARPKASLMVTSSNGRPDPDPVRCPESLANGCRATSAETRVSAALAMVTTKSSRSKSDRTRDGIRGWDVLWELEVLVGGDGDPRGDARPRPGPYVLHDWWQDAIPSGPAVDMGASLVGCTTGVGRNWSCVQPGGPGAPITVTLPDIDPDDWSPTTSGQNLVSRRDEATVGRVTLTVFYARDSVAAAGGNVKIENCFATVPGDPAAAEFAPTGTGGEPNLGGLSEPLGDNCAGQWLTVPVPSRGRAPSVYKYYAPGWFPNLLEVTPGEVIPTWTGVQNQNVEGEGPPGMEGVIACDAFDNYTQELVRAMASEEIGEVAAWVRASDLSGRDVALDPTAAVIEFASGPWGTSVPEGRSRGDGYYAQSRAQCTDALPVNAAGWVPAGDIDFGNGGEGRLDAAEVNVIRARFRDPIPPRQQRLLFGHLRVRSSPPGTLLVNWGSGYTSSDPSPGWVLGDCNGRERTTCPDPPRLDTFGWDPGSRGDARIVVQAPTSLRKEVSPNVAPAGGTARFRLAVAADRDRRYPVADDLVAADVVVTDVLPSGLAYVPDSAVRLGEDNNGNGRLDPLEDSNGNGRLDPKAPAPPELQPDVPAAGAMTMVWRLGPIVSRTYPIVVTYDTRIDALVPGGRGLANRAEVRAFGETLASCTSERHPWRCAAATVKVVNTSRAAVAKTADPVVIGPTDAAHFRLRFANLTLRSIEWLDAVDILPHAGDPRVPASRLAAPWAAITVTVSSGPAPIAVWASTRAPDWLDMAGGSLRDGVADPVTAYGAPGAGLGGADWPCLLSDVGTAACPAVASLGAVTALRFWAPDPDPAASGSPSTSLLPVESDPREIDLWLGPGLLRPGDLLHNAWGGRFEGLVLPAFASAVARVPFAPLYLPIALRRPCWPQPIAVAIVVDASTSMRRPSGIGGTKMDAVLSAAGRLSDMLLGDPVRHEVAVIGFNSRAWIAQPLGRDAAAARDALGRVAGATAEGTRLDLGLAVGAEALAGVPVTRRAMVFLTDGLPNLVPLGPGGTQEETVLAAAAAARAQGVVIHAVGYGRADAADPSDRVSPELLAAIATGGGTSRIAPDAASLVEVFEAVGRDLRCGR